MNHLRLSLLLIGLTACMAGCGQTKDATKTSQPGKAGGSSPAVAAPASPDTAGVTSPTSAAEATPTSGPASAGTPIEGPTGRIEGAVTYVGSDMPKPTIVVNGTDPQICGAEVSKRDIEISPSTRGIRFVLLWLEDVKLPKGYKPPPQNLILDNTHCQFEPHAAAITVGSVIETRNSDEVYHTTNLLGKVMKENIPLVSKGAAFKTKTRTPELIGVKCDKHGWMQAFIRVDPHPFHAVSDADGKFAIADVPVGTYKLKVWHETFSSQQLEVTVKEDEATKLELKYPATE